MSCVVKRIFIHIVSHINKHTQVTAIYNMTNYSEIVPRMAK